MSKVLKNIMSKKIIWKFHQILSHSLELTVDTKVGQEDELTSCYENFLFQKWMKYW